MHTVSSSRSTHGFVLLLVLSVFCLVLRAGFRPEPRVIPESETAVAARVYTADLDGDGDMDVLLSSFFDGTLAWLERQGNQ